MAHIDARDKSITDINREIRLMAACGEEIVIDYPDARHQLCVGLLAPAMVTIQGSAGYFCGGLSDEPIIFIANNVGWGVADNLLSGSVVVGQPEAVVKAKLEERINDVLKSFAEGWDGAGDIRREKDNEPESDGGR